MRLTLSALILLLTVFAPATVAWSQEPDLITPPELSRVQPEEEQPAPVETTLGRGTLPDKNIVNLPAPNAKELKEAADVYKICADGRGQNYVDCDCSSLTYLQMRVTERAQGLKPSDGYEMRTAAQKACPNTVGLAGYTYKTCMGWAPRMYQDYEELCSCYANSYAEKFGANPTDSLRVNQKLMTAALISCNAGRAATLNLERTKKIKEMKRLGIYDELFPSAKESGLATTLPAKDPTLSTAPPSQRLSDQLLAPDTDPRIPDR